jgi:hypothetical protein
VELISFHRGEHGAPGFMVADDSYSALGSMLTSDVQNVESWCRDLLAMIERIRGGAAQESWQGNSWSATLSAAGLHLQDLYSDDWQGDHSLDDAHSVVLKYLDFLAPGAGRKSAVVMEWESKNGRRHPCRDHM